ncbi:hypothetical protein [Haloarchaeobius sp. DYHT-AS-18]|uniref:hypothetical protein n=1 Tax=Haloarchaeobius sp. DYHT-AS-18 TaxID=3446117 RepID=UPI003EBFAAE8
MFEFVREDRPSITGESPQGLEAVGLAVKNYTVLLVLNLCVFTIFQGALVIFLWLNVTTPGLKNYISPLMVTIMFIAGISFSLLFVLKKLASTLIAIMSELTPPYENPRIVFSIPITNSVGFIDSDSIYIKPLKSAMIWFILILPVYIPVIGWFEFSTNPETDVNTVINTVPEILVTVLLSVLAKTTPLPVNQLSNLIRDPAITFLQLVVYGPSVLFFSLLSLNVIYAMRLYVYHVTGVKSKN